MFPWPYAYAYTAYKVTSMVGLPSVPNLNLMSSDKTSTSLPKDDFLKCINRDPLYPNYAYENSIDSKPLLPKPEKWNGHVDTLQAFIGRAERYLNSFAPRLTAPVALQLYLDLLPLEVAAAIEDGSLPSNFFVSNVFTTPQDISDRLRYIYKPSYELFTKSYEQKLRKLSMEFSNSEDTQTPNTNTQQLQLENYAQSHFLISRFLKNTDRFFIDSFMEGLNDNLKDKYLELSKSESSYLEFLHKIIATEKLSNDDSAYEKIDSRSSLDLKK